VPILRSEPRNGCRKTSGENEDDENDHDDANRQ
jgi:hypothetical protein